MPNLPMTISLNSLPMMILQETTIEKPNTIGDTEAHLPYQSVFRPNPNGRELTGTVIGSHQPFQLGLRGVNKVSECGITLVHAPYDDVKLPIIAENPPTWMAVSNFEGGHPQSVCYIPVISRPLLTFTQIHLHAFDRDLPDDTPEDRIESLMKDMFHVLLIDYTRKHDPGSHTYFNLRSFHTATRKYQGHAFDLFRHAA